MPFSGRWFYGDALFVIDPWFWLIVGGAAFLTFSKSRLARVRWAEFFVLATWLIFANTGLVPAMSAVLWVGGAAVLVLVRWSLRDAPPATLERAAQAGIAVAAVCVVVPEASRYLVWARFPAADVEATPGGGTRVRFWDVRYADRIFGPTIELPTGAVSLGSD
jgi:hypothetical protein